MIQVCTGKQINLYHIIICVKMSVFAGVALGEACTIVLRGATQQILDEAERSLHDALCVLSQTVKETKTVYGGGECQYCGCIVNIKQCTQNSTGRRDTRLHMIILGNFMKLADTSEAGVAVIDFFTSVPYGMVQLRGLPTLRISL